MTSCPRLPPGGISKVHIEVAGVSKPTSKLPTSRACSSQLYLGHYSSKDDLQKFLHEAMYSSVGNHEQGVTAGGRL